MKYKQKRRSDALRQNFKHDKSFRRRKKIRFYAILVMITYINLTSAELPGGISVPP